MAHTGSASIRDALPLEEPSAGNRARRQHAAVPRPDAASQGPSSLQSLAHGHSVSSPTASKLVSTLVEKGLVDRRLDPSDRRLVLLSLTEKGEARREAWYERTISLVSERVALLDRDEREALVKGLSTFAHALPAMPE